MAGSQQNVFGNFMLAGGIQGCGRPFACCSAFVSGTLGVLSRPDLCFGAVCVTWPAASMFISCQVVWMLTSAYVCSLKSGATIMIRYVAAARYSPLARRIGCACVLTCIAHVLHERHCKGGCLPLRMRCVSYSRVWLCCASPVVHTWSDVTTACFDSLPDTSLMC